MFIQCHRSGGAIVGCTLRTLLKSIENAFPIAQINKLATHGNKTSSKNTHHPDLTSLLHLPVDAKKKMLKIAFECETHTHFILKLRMYGGPTLCERSAWKCSLNWLRLEMIIGIKSRKRASYWNPRQKSRVLWAQKVKTRKSGSFHEWKQP